MPPSITAAVVLLVLFVPGYLFQAGVKEYTSVLTAERDIYAIAQAVALSAGFIVFFLFALNLVEAIGLIDTQGAREELLKEPSGTIGLNMAQSAALIVLLVAPVPLGRLFGQISARNDEAAAAQAPPAGSSSDAPSAPSRPARTLKAIFDFFFRPSPVKAQIKSISRQQPPVYVRIVRQGEDDVVGAIDAGAAEASSSPLGQGLALATRWAPNEKGEWVSLPGGHVGIADVIKIFSWCPQTEPNPPAWLGHFPVAEVQAATPAFAAEG